MADFKPTLNQKRAIESRECSLLVSAGAGSGKTKVISERILSYLCDAETPVSLDKFLIITFTKAAAAELKTRIGTTIQEKLRDNPDNKWLRDQSLMSQYAHIGTIHSFCQEILREYSHNLGIIPDFKVLDEGRAYAMKYSAINRIMDDRYNDMDKYDGFEEIVSSVCGGRDDERLVELVLNIYEKIQCHAFPDKYIKMQKEQFERKNFNDISETIWGREIISQAKRKAANYKTEMGEILSELSTCEKVEAAYGDVCQENYDLLQKFIDSGDDLSWDRYMSLVTIETQKLKKSSKLSEDEKIFKEYIKSRIDNCREKIKKLGETFQAPSSELMKDLYRIEKPMVALLCLVEDFSKEYKKVKKRAGMLDFSDLEHYTAKLLVDEDGKKTDIAEEISRRYKEILVDEFQDVSSVQAFIFSAISKNEKNLFMVGDVKQSIYRFRLANPGIFLDKYKEYSDYEQAEGKVNKRILLKENFRSREEIIKAINHVFRTCMSEQVGDLKYDEDAELNFGAAYYDETAVKPEIIVVEKKQEDNADSVEAEASVVADKIKQLMNENICVNDNGTKRKASYGDIAILLRAANTDGKAYRKVLVENGIPVEAGFGEGFFDSMEILTVMSMLSVIDNPRQDVPLISVLRSPIIGITADELAKIRVSERKADFYDAVVKSRDENRKCREFLDILSELRKLAPDTELSEFIWMIYDRFDIIAVFEAMQNGEERHENLMQLLIYAKKYGTTGYQGIHRFIEWVNNMKARGMEPEMASKENSAVKIMSIHKSKGLEFPIVFLCETGKQFNKQDMKEAVLVHPELGLGPKVVDEKKRLEYPSFAKIAIKGRIEQENMSEEMRLLYVALTRARERLIITGKLSDVPKVLENVSDKAKSPMPAFEIEGASSPIYWLLYAALSDKQNLFTISKVSCVSDGKEFSGELEKFEELSEEEFVIPENFEYVYESAVHLPSKVTATELKSKYAADNAEEDSFDIVKTKLNMEFRPLNIEKNKKISAAKIGTATHLLLEKMDLRKDHAEQTVKESLEHLVDAGYITESEAENINIGSIVSFLRSDIGKQLKTAEKVYREFRFSVLLPVDRLFKEHIEDKILLQGTIDCWYEKNDEIVIIDYKTDRLDENNIEERNKIYTVQLKAYADALREITGKKIKETVIYYLNMEKIVKVTV